MWPGLLAQFAARFVGGLTATERRFLRTIATYESQVVPFTVLRRAVGDTTAFGGGNSVVTDMLSSLVRRGTIFQPDPNHVAFVDPSLSQYVLKQL